jgi:hypothetical protein
MGKINGPFWEKDGLLYCDEECITGVPIGKDGWQWNIGYSLKKAQPINEEKGD